MRISVCNSVGRRLRCCRTPTFPPDAMRSVWNGTDEGGADVGSGMYLCRMIVTNRNTGKVMQKTISMMLVR